MENKRDRTETVHKVGTLTVRISEMPFFGRASKFGVQVGRSYEVSGDVPGTKVEKHIPWMTPEQLTELVTALPAIQNILGAAMDGAEARVTEEAKKFAKKKAKPWPGQDQGKREPDQKKLRELARPPQQKPFDDKASRKAKEAQAKFTAALAEKVAP